VSSRVALAISDDLVAWRRLGPYEELHPDAELGGPPASAGEPL